jgi:RimJ/RimL family protein N-acetyltransferase
MHVHLETPRLRLRRFTGGDAERLIELDSDPEVMRYLTGGVPTPPARIRDVVLPDFLAWYARSPDYGYWAAEHRVTGEFLGWFHLRPPRDPAAAEDPLLRDALELGYRLRRSAWNKGYATEGARALVNRAFRELDAPRVIAYTMAQNAASRRVLEKAGLRLARIGPGHPRRPGREYDEMLYVVSRDEWAGADGAR